MQVKLTMRSNRSRVVNRPRPLDDLPVLRSIVGSTLLSHIQRPSSHIEASRYAPQVPYRHHVDESQQSGRPLTVSGPPGFYRGHLPPR